MNFVAYLIAIVIVYRNYLIGVLLVAASGLLLFSFEPQSFKYDSRPDAGRAPISVATELRVGQSYASSPALQATLKSMGYVSTGRFGNSWPAEVTEILEGKDGIRFVRQDGTAHNYRNFTGYRMKAVRLLGRDRKETLLVFRSEAKR